MTNVFYIFKKEGGNRGVAVIMASSEDDALRELGEHLEKAGLRLSALTHEAIGKAGWFLEARILCPDGKGFFYIYDLPESPEKTTKAAIGVFPEGGEPGVLF